VSVRRFELRSGPPVAGCTYLEASTQPELLRELRVYVDTDELPGAVLKLAYIWDVRTPRVAGRWTIAEADA